uniref:TXNDC11 thioredoxin-like domain-containing protein n=1 Tax=Hucho hucho TaxID=62062 RepID=A0A4W5M9A2_9TELE
ILRKLPDFCNPSHVFHVCSLFSSPASQPGVVGYFQFNSSPQPPGYITYLSSALQALKRDFRGAVRFGVVTSRQVAESISVRDDQTVYLHRHFNSSLVSQHTHTPLSTDTSAPHWSVNTHTPLSTDTLATHWSVNTHTPLSTDTSTPYWSVNTHTPLS